MQNEIKNFIYKYINEVILKDIGTMSYNYFIKSIENIAIENQNIFPYNLFTKLDNEGKVAYTSLRVETVDLSLLNKEAGVYYNYARFSLTKEFLSIELMQSKTGGMPIDEDIIKYTKNIPIKKTGLKEFIKKNS